MEAKWFNMGYTPSLHEYLSKALISLIGPVLLIHEFYSMGHEIGDGRQPATIHDKTQPKTTTTAKSTKNHKPATSSTNKLRRREQIRSAN